MLQLIEHIIRIASRRDRTEINSALVDAMRDVFDPAALAVHRCYPAAGSMIVFTCAGLGPGGQFSHNAYLPERRYCEPIDHDPLLQCCQDERAIVREARADGADRRVLLMGLVEYIRPSHPPARPRRGRHPDRSRQSQNLRQASVPGAGQGCRRRHAGGLGTTRDEVCRTLIGAGGTHCPQTVAIRYLSRRPNAAILQTCAETLQPRRLTSPPRKTRPP